MRKRNDKEGVFAEQYAVADARKLVPLSFTFD